MTKKILEKCYVKVYKISSYFYEHYEKYKARKNGHEYISFRIDVYFIKYSLAVEIDEKSMLSEILFFRRKDKKL